MLPSDLKLLIRADASPQIGTGHISRCLSLAKAWKAIGGCTSFACGNLPELLRRSIVEQGFSVHALAHANGDSDDACETDQVAIDFKADWIVLDGDRFDDVYQAKLQKSNARLMVVDDTGCAGNSAADLAVKQLCLDHHANGAPETGLQQCLNGFDFFLPIVGVEYPNSVEGERRIVAQARRILLTMGNTDKTDVARQILESLGQLKSVNLVVDLIVAADYPHGEELWRINKETGINLRCHRNLDRASGLVNRIDLAITSAGVGCLELARQGCPAILVSTDDSQIPLARELDRLGVAVDAGPATMLDIEVFTNLVRSVSRNTDLRCQMSRRGPQLVDGQGAARVARRLAAAQFELRPARISDAHALHSWRNEPEYRALSFSPQPISLASHHTWLERKLKSSDSLIWIVSDKSGTSIGTIAVDSLDCETANLAVCLCPAQRGRGLGPILIEKASRKLFQEHNVDRILVQFKPGNTASQQAFKKAGYRPIAPTTVNGLTALQMVFERSTQKYPEPSASPLRKSA
jgi:spore coat polysaccharide biosynthesis predicted glycosyltransferase SpsG